MEAHEGGAALCDDDVLFRKDGVELGRRHFFEFLLSAEMEERGSFWTPLRGSIEDAPHRVIVLGVLVHGGH